ncbi:hypothetical protein GBAR_LOCUS17849, partial [Geodia barretti]
RVPKQQQAKKATAHNGDGPFAPGKHRLYIVRNYGIPSLLSPTQLLQPATVPRDLISAGHTHCCTVCNPKHTRAIVFSARKLIRPRLRPVNILRVKT